MGGARQSREQLVEVVVAEVGRGGRFRHVWNPPCGEQPPPPLPVPPTTRSEKQDKTDKLDACRGEGRGVTGRRGGGGGGGVPPVLKGAVPSTRLTDGGRVLGAGGRPLLVKVVVQVPSCRREQRPRTH